MASVPNRTGCRVALAVYLALFLVPCLVQAQFIHIFEVQDENRAPKSDLFNPSDYNYVSPAQLQKKQAQNKLLQEANNPPTTRPTQPPPTTRPAPEVPEYRSSGPATINTALGGEDRYSEISPSSHRSRPSSDNAYSRHRHDMEALTTLPPPTMPSPPVSTVPPPVTYMQPISRILANISTNEIPSESEMELRKQIRGLPQSENRYSRTTPLRVSAQNQRPYVIRVPPPFGPPGQPGLLPHEQLPPNLAQMQGSQFSPANQAAASPVTAQSSPRLSTLNSVLSGPRSPDQGIPSSLLNNFLQRQQQPQQQPPQHQSAAQPPYAANLVPNYVTPATPRALPQQLQTPSQGPTVPSPPTGRSVGGSQQTPALTLQSVLQPPVTNKESLTDDDIRMIEEHNRKVRLFLQQRQAELNQEQDRLRAQKAAEEAAAAKAQQEAANRAADQERMRRLRAEQEQAARAAAEQERYNRLRAEQEAAARAAADAERQRRIKEEQEAASRAAAEADRIRRIRAEQEAAARAAAEQERIARIRAEQEAEARAAAEAERARRIKAEQEAAARAAEEERIRRIQEEQEAAARAAAEEERISRIRAEQEAAARAAAEAERIRRYRAEQEAAARVAAEQERTRRIKAEQEAAARAAAEADRVRRIKAQQEHLRRLRDEQEAAARAAAEQDRTRRIQEEQQRAHRLRAEQEAAANAAATANEQERLRQLRAQQEAAARLAEAERERLTHLRAEQEIAAIRARYQNVNLPAPNATSSNLSYQPESNLDFEDSMRLRPGQQDSMDTLRLRPEQHEPAGDTMRLRPGQQNSVDSARTRAEKEALAEQERLLRFQASQQVLAQQQAAEQARLRRLREEEMLRAEEERAAREAQERLILRAREEQNSRIQNARDAATGSAYTANAYTEDINKYPSQPASNYSEPLPPYGSLNNVRSPEPRRISSVYRTRGTPAPAVSSSDDPQPTSAAIPSISSDYVRRVVVPKYQRNLSYANQTSSSSLSPNRVPARQLDASESTSSNRRDSSTSSGHRPAKISLQELPPDLDADGIPGVAGKDYPTLTEIPKTSFSCARQPLNGYYADTETACQVVHMCQAGGVQDSFLCPNGTIWNQEKFACQWWYEVSCATAPSFYALNNKLYKGNEADEDKSSSNSRQA